MRPSVIAVVLNYKHPDDTIRCSESLARVQYRNLSVLVVDNASGDDVAQRLRENLEPTTTLIVNDKNLGYAAGNNVGISEALRRGADFVWIINPDVVVDPNSLTALVDTSEVRPDAGIIGSRILYGDSDPPKIWFGGGVIDWSRGGATTHLHMGELDERVRATGPYPVDYVTGAAMLVRRLVFDEVGLLPEEYFLYFEETDFNLAMQKRGWATLVQPRSRLWHFKRSTGPLPQPYYVYYFIRNRLVFGTRYGRQSADEIAHDLSQFIDAWRIKVTRNAPEWVTVYDELVSTAIDHGRDGYIGQWPGLDDYPLPTLTAR